MSPSWVEFVGRFPSRQLIVMLNQGGSPQQPRWKWVWNSSYTGMLQDIPLGEVSTEIGQEIREENGRLREGRISWQEDGLYGLFPVSLPDES